MHASVVSTFTFNNLTQGRQGRFQICQGVWRNCQKDSYDKIHNNSHPQGEIFYTPSPPQRVMRASWCTWWCTHCPYMGCLNNCPVEPWRRRWTELRLQCHCMSTEGDGGMWVCGMWTAIGWAAITWGRGYGAAMVCRECAEGMGTGIGMEGVWVAYACCMAVYCAPCYWPMVEWGSVWAGIEGLPRVLVLFVNRGVRPFPPPGWSASHSLQSSSPILGSSSCRRWAGLWFLNFQFLIQSWHN